MADLDQTGSGTKERFFEGAYDRPMLLDQAGIARRSTETLR